MTSESAWKTRRPREQSDAAIGCGHHVPSTACGLEYGPNSEAPEKTCKSDYEDKDDRMQKQMHELGLRVES